MKFFFYLILGICLAGCAENVELKKSSFEPELKEFRKFRNKKMSGNGSPIPSKDKNNFVGLNFYPADESFYFKAHFSLLFSQQVTEMKTNTNRIPKFLPYGEISFIFNEKKYVLIAYKSLDDPSEELFLPFTDLTCGNGSHETGRYLDLEIPNNDTIILDFNRCYNPYCAYNSKYSCPIPPAENNLLISIDAGERNFHN